MKSKNILFLTGTRADFGKLKSLIKSVDASERYEYALFVTGMHMLSKFGNTLNEIERSGFKNLFTYFNQAAGDSMEITLANTITGLSHYLRENKVDLIVVHGDRVEALAGATVGALRNILVAHIEGGEISGTIDELMRHAITKLSHLHFVASETALKRLVQLGEDPSSIFIIGSPDIDLMLSPSLPSLEEAKKHYEITFEDYAMATLHPVTTEGKLNKKYADEFVEALRNSNHNYIVIHPNNDSGSEYILDSYEKLKNSSRIKLFPSLRFEYFLALLKNSKFIIGNSSAGIHEAPVYGIPTINVGSRQNNRFHYESIFNVSFDQKEICDLVKQLEKNKNFNPTTFYGDGTSAKKFIEALDSDIWKVPRQKQFKDIEYV